MKPRRVVLTIETETSLPIRVFRSWKGFNLCVMDEDGSLEESCITVKQIQANVVTKKGE